MRTEKLYLVDIVEAADAIADFLVGQTHEDFERNEMLRSAILHKLMIIGEAAAKTSHEMRLRHTDVPWSRIAGFRNIIVHVYFATDWDAVWKAATEDVLALRAKVADILFSEFPETQSQMDL